MPLSIPHSFTTGTAIEATKLQANQDAERKYINKTIVVADFADSFITTQDMIRGEYYGVSRDHQFMSGDMYTHFYDAQPFNRTYITGETKQVDDLSTISDYQKIANTGKQFYVEQNCIVIFHGWLETVVPDEHLNLVNVGTDAKIYLEVNGTRPACSFSYAFREGSAGSAISGATGGNKCNRRFYPISYIKSLNAGWNTMCIVMDCPTEQAYIGAKSISLEIFYI